jgi:prepilin-type N-terminal cleavage/methylation domain-containing protein
VRTEQPGCSGSKGFSLVEVVIAAALLATSLVALAELFAVAVQNNAAAKNATFAAALAAQKMEELRGDAVSAPSSASANALRVPTDGYMDVVDQNGSTYIRRWSIEPVPGSSAVVLQVLVTRRGDRGAADAASVVRAPEEARVITVRRRAP